MIARPRDHVIPPDLPALAEAVARWVDGVEDVPAIYLFGSRVRGDHRPDSDVDLCLFLDEMGAGDPRTNDDWWVGQHRTAFASLRATMPGPPKIIIDWEDPAQRWVRDARADPSRLVVRMRKAVCLWTPPKTTLPRDSASA